MLKQGFAVQLRCGREPPPSPAPVAVTSAQLDKPLAYTSPPAGTSSSISLSTYLASTLKQAATSPSSRLLTPLTPMSQQAETPQSTAFMTPLVSTSHQTATLSSSGLSISLSDVAAGRDFAVNQPHDSSRIVVPADRDINFSRPPHCNVRISHRTNQGYAVRRTQAYRQLTSNSSPPVRVSGAR